MFRQGYRNGGGWQVWLFGGLRIGDRGLRARGLSFLLSFSLSRADLQMQTYLVLNDRRPRIRAVKPCLVHRRDPVDKRFHYNLPSSLLLL